MLIRGCSSPGRATGSQSVGSQFKSGQLQEEVEWMNLKIAPSIRNFFNGSSIGTGSSPVSSKKKGL